LKLGCGDDHAATRDQQGNQTVLTTVTVTSAAELTAALALAAGGDTIRLAAGQYGDLTISKKTYASDLTIASADASHPAEFNSILVTGSSGVRFEGLNVNLLPSPLTTTFSAVVRIVSSSQVTFTGGHVQARLATTGVPQTSTTLDSTGNVIGLPTARGFSIESSGSVLVQGVEITQVFKGIVLSGVQNVAIRGNNIHDFRTSAIVAGDADHVVIDGNRLEGSHPFGPDHADFIHFITSPGQPNSASTDVAITNNVLDVGDGLPPLGIYFDDNGYGVGFSQLNISGNLILNQVGQGVRLENVSASTVTGNVLLQTGPITNHTPGIVTDGSASSLEISGNITAFANNNPNSQANIHDNTLVQNTTAGSSGYYTTALATQAQAIGELAAVKLLLVQDWMVDTAVQAVLRTSAGAAAVSAMAADLKTGLNAGALSDMAVAASLVHAAAATTSVATLSYEFFTGKAPSSAGMDYLVSPTGSNKNNLNSTYFQSFSLENRYINFAVNLGKVGEGKAAFQASYGSLDLFSATKKAYTTIFGDAPSDAKVHDLLDTSFTLNGLTMTRAQYLAGYGGDGANGQGTKAAMVGFLLAEAVKADLGVYALSNDAFLTDVALHNAAFGVDVVGSYSRPEYVYHPG
jgi:hypothetical protein